MESKINVDATFRAILFGQGGGDGTGSGGVRYCLAFFVAFCVTIATCPVREKRILDPTRERAIAGGRWWR